MPQNLVKDTEESHHVADLRHDIAPLLRTVRTSSKDNVDLLNQGWWL